MLKNSLSYFWHHTGRLAHFMVIVGGLAFIALFIGVLAMRYWVLPDIMRYHDRIQGAISQAIGQPVEIGAIKADWDGFRPHLVMGEIKVLDAQRQPALYLTKIESTLAWRSLLMGKLSLHSLELNHPILVLRRDPQGKLYVAGVPLSSSQDNRLADWLLYQQLIVIRGAQLYWLDELRGADTLRLDSLDAVITNQKDRHRFSLHADLPAELATPLDLRGDFAGRSFDRLSEWKGEFYVKLDHTDVRAWQPWLDLPKSISQGRGGVRAWIGVEGGRLAETAADVVLQDVVSKLGEDVPELALRHLHGRLAWRESRGEFEVSSRQLEMRLMQGTVLPPTDFFLKVAETGGVYPPRGEIRANHLHLPTLLNLSQFFPLEHAMREQLRLLAPEGEVNGLQAQWEFEGEHLKTYQVEGHFNGLGLHQVDGLPGFSNLTGDVSGSEESGTLSVSAKNLSVQAPMYLRDPLAFPSLKAQMRWQQKRGGTELALTESSFANADVAGSASGTFQMVENSPGVIDLTVNLSRADLKHTARYIPLTALNKETHDWLATALQGGQTEKFRLRLQGDLRDFPFHGGRRGVFQIEALARNVAVEYASGWPRIEEAYTELRMQGPRMEVRAPQASTLGGRLQNVKVVLEDIAKPGAPLLIHGEAVGPIRYPLEFIQRSPVRGYIDGFTDDMKASGDGRLDLDIRLPLTGSEPLKVDGRYTFHDNEVEFIPGLPLVSKVNGVLQFGESSVHAANLTGQWLGGNVGAQINSESGVMRAKVLGQFNPDAMRGAEPYPVMRFLHGQTGWTADISAKGKVVDTVVSSNLQGLASDLPPPFGKGAAQPVAFRLEKRSTQPGQDLVTVQYGNVVEARFLRQQSGDEMRVARGTVHFGPAGTLMEKEGVWVSGNIPLLSLDGWQGVSGDGGSLPSIAGMDLTVQQLVAFRHVVESARLTGRSRNDVLEVQIAAGDANGALRWTSQVGGILTAHLKNLKLDPLPAALLQQLPTVSTTAGAADHPPRLDVVVDSLNWEGKQLGHFELAGQPQGKDWKLEKLRLNNPDGVLNVDGVIQSHNGGDITRLGVNLQINDSGKILDRSGYPNSVKQGSGKLEGRLVWQGGPSQFNYATLDGVIKLDAGRGQFMKIDPGIGKLLSILSLQALPKRITLDFKDVFSEGFQFDSMSGEAQIKQGVMRTDNFSIDGSAARINMKGDVDLNHESQNLNVRILPTVGNTVSLVGAVIVNPVVGLGTYLANKVLNSPIDQLVAFEYKVTGTWTNPNVVKVSAEPVKPVQSPNVLESN